MTQAELASRAGVTVETVARLERVLRGRASANANPSLETMERIASSLGVDVSDLVSPSKTRPKDDRLNVVLRGASSTVRRRVLVLTEALIRDEQSEARQAKADGKSEGKKADGKSEGKKVDGKSDGKLKRAVKRR